MSTRGLTVPARAGPFLPAPPPRPDTEAVRGKLASEPGGAWRPWSIWLPCAPTFACSGALIVAARASLVVGRWDPLAPGLSSLATGAAGQGVLAAVDVGDPDGGREASPTCPSEVACSGSFGAGDA